MMIPASKWLLVGLAVTPVVVVVATSASNVIISILDRLRFPTRGTLVKVGPRKVHVVDSNEVRRCGRST